MTDRPRSETEPLESTADLLQRVRTGDETARNRLMSRFIPLLTHWAHGRLGPSARGMIDTDDLVQTTMLRAIKQMEHFEPRGEGSFLAYLRRILINLIKDEARKHKRRPDHVAIDQDVLDHGPSPLETVIGWNTLERYERALEHLSEDQQEAILMRIEFGYSYEQMAAAMNRPSANAARLVVSRALIKLAEEMRETR